MDNVNVLLEPIRASLHQVGAFLPRVLLAIAILIVGWLIAKAVRFALVRTLRALNFNVITEQGRASTRSCGRAAATWTRSACSARSPTGW